MTRRPAPCSWTERKAEAAWGKGRSTKTGTSCANVDLTPILGA
ncbi:hypothetical protein [Halobacillus campisalis]|uniref:Uncharacterized protein n=1 Tax=Halobacillus campisalis TaxID=435909 RepID=A0ABW2JZT8_9BACI|nr:hypothetical protein [Halobacillus campisalis]